MALLIIYIIAVLFHQKYVVLKLLPALGALACAGLEAIDGAVALVKALIYRRGWSELVSPASQKLIVKF